MSYKELDKTLSSLSLNLLNPIYDMFEKYHPELLNQLATKLDVAPNKSTRELLISWSEENGSIASIYEFIEILSSFEEPDIKELGDNIFKSVVKNTENINIRDKIICVVCLSNERNVLIKPCNHVCVCNSCLDILKEKKCPMCRTDISNTEIVYL